MPADVIMNTRGNQEAASTPGGHVADLEFEYVKDVVTAMKRQEATTYLRCDYLANQQLQHVLDGEWRQRIIEWMFSVVDHVGLKRDGVASAAFLLDLYVQSGIVKSKAEFQLAAMTALQLSIKIGESTSVKLQSLVALGRGLFTAEDVISMERSMLSTLNWNVHAPTPVCFLRQFLRLIPPSVPPFTRYMIAEVTRFISEISTCLYRFVKHPPSTVAFAGMIIAMDRFDEQSLSSQQRREIYSAMSRVGMDAGSSQVMETLAALQLSLENNASMNELLSTINSQATNGTSCTNKCIWNSSDYPAQPSPLGSHMNSPRDVTGRP